MALPTEVLWSLQGHKGGISRVRFTTAGKYCITAGLSDKSVRLWNPMRMGAAGDGGLLLQTYTGPHGFEINDARVCVRGAGCAQSDAR